MSSSQITQAIQRCVSPVINFAFVIFKFGQSFNGTFRGFILISKSSEMSSVFVNLRILFGRKFQLVVRNILIFLRILLFME